MNALFDVATKICVVGCGIDLSKLIRWCDLSAHECVFINCISMDMCRAQCLSIWFFALIVRIWRSGIQGENIFFRGYY